MRRRMVQPPTPKGLEAKASKLLWPRLVLNRRGATNYQDWLSKRRRGGRKTLADTFVFIDELAAGFLFAQDYLGGYG